MKIIKIPEDINEIADLSEFKDTIREVRLFEINIKNFAEKIARDKFLKRNQEWLEILSEKDIKKNKLREKENNSLLLYDYQDNSFVVVDSFYCGWERGASTAKKYTFEFNDDATVIIIKVEWQTQEARFNHIPWIKQEKFYYIDYINNTLLSSTEVKKRNKNN